jgi:hypothetical protein
VYAHPALVRIVLLKAELIMPLFLSLCVCFVISQQATRSGRHTQP